MGPLVLCIAHLEIDYAGSDGLSDVDPIERLEAIGEEHDSAITAGVGSPV